MSHTHSAHARGPDTGAGRTPLFQSEAFAPYPTKAVEPAPARQQGGLDSCDFDALDWLRFWLPESDWHTRRTRTDRKG